MLRRLSHDRDPALLDFNNRITVSLYTDADGEPNFVSVTLGSRVLGPFIFTLSRRHGIQSMLLEKYAYFNKKSFYWLF